MLANIRRQWTAQQSRREVHSLIDKRDCESTFDRRELAVFFEGIIVDYSVVFRDRQIVPIEQPMVQGIQKESVPDIHSLLRCTSFPRNDVACVECVWKFHAGERTTI